MVNMGELFAFPRILPMKMDRVLVGDKERSFILQDGDLLYARQSLVFEGAGKCSIFLGGHEPTVFESHIIRCRLNRRKADPLFYFFFFQSPLGRDAISSIVEQGAGAAGIRASDLAKLLVPVPPLPFQIAASSVLNALDERIETLRKANSSLEAIARAIFKSWFVDFDPVRAKAEGREPEGMDADTAALFPSEFQESELCQIPRGWNIEGFDSAVDITSGGTPKTSRPEYWGGDIPWFSIVDAPSPSEVFVIETEKQITDAGLANCAARLLPIGATIISARGTVGKLAVTGVPMAINQSCYALLSRVFGTYGTFFQTGCLVDTLRQFAHGAVFSTITRDTLTAIKVVTPPKAIADSYEEAAGPLMDTILNNRKMSATLADLRDTLLPRLISGKLRVPEAEAIITKRGE
jgi:type I restriction enzyme S subunit